MSFEKSLEDSWEEIQDDNSSEEEEFLEDEYFFEEEDADAFFFCENENQGECADGCICDQSLFTFEEIIEEKYQKNLKKQRKSVRSVSYAMKGFSSFMSGKK